MTPYEFVGAVEITKEPFCSRCLTWWFSTWSLYPDCLDLNLSYHSLIKCISMPQFPHLSNGGNNSNYLIGL